MNRKKTVGPRGCMATLYNMWRVPSPPLYYMYPPYIPFLNKLSGMP